MTQSIGESYIDLTDLPPVLFGHWIHSRAEDAAGLEVYRPEGFPFPPAFGRDGFHIFVDGRFVQEDIGPADGIVETEGRWERIGPRLISVSFPRGTEREGYTFEVVDVDTEVLRIRRGPGVVEPYGYATCQPMTDQHLAAYEALPPATTPKRLDFSFARLITLESFPPQFVLEVSGTKPYVNMDVALEPLVYVRQPEYWEIEVVGKLAGIGLPVATPYRVSIRLNGIIGTRGVEVVGASRRQRFDVPVETTEQGGCSEWSAFVDRQPPGPAALIVTGTCEFRSGGFTVELRRREPQGINPRNLLLNKIVTPPSGPSTDAITQVTVRYEEETTAGFDSVTILPDGPTLQVQEVF